MAKEIVTINSPKKIESEQTTVWWKVDKYFINQENIRALSKKGIRKGTTIKLHQGEDVFVNVAYEKLLELFPAGNMN